MARLEFAIRMLKERWNKERALCPYCDSIFSLRLQRKWMLIEARKCVHCGLIFRWPTDSANAAAAFYSHDYDGQQATDVPRPDELAILTAGNFAATQFDKKHRIAFIERTLGPPAGRKLLDFGCSWGYSVWQYRAAGWIASGFEIDVKRAIYGANELKLDIRAGLESFEERASFDVILADHSLEHLADPHTALDKLTKMAKANASLVIFVPNGSCLEARRLGTGWGPLIGEAHTIAFTVDWFVRNLPRHGWSPAFYNSSAIRLSPGEYLSEGSEICLVAQLAVQKL